ncbi:MAG: hypothetical protein KDD45_16390, partial [Bdellovibrionales bacterium]|nr:hypothetical protein [Bdellovibrionales bacterium]
MKQVVNSIKKANKILLTTHKDSDGDGLGAEMAMFYALKKLNKEVFIYHVDAPPKKYEALIDKDLINIFSKQKPLSTFDLALVFDTNDERLVEPLFSAMVPNISETI